MKSLLLLLSFISFCVVFAQDKKILNEQFSDNSGNWPNVKTAMGSSTVNTGRGMYILKNSDEIDNFTAMKDIGIDTKRDFKFEAQFYKEKGVKNFGYGLVWGGRTDNYYSLLIAATGYYCYGKVENGIWVDITDWVSVPAITQGNKKYNSISVTKKGSTYGFEVNKTRVGTITAAAFFGNEIGFNVNNKQQILVDWATFTYLD